MNFIKIFSILSYFPLWIFHAIGVIFGWIIYLSSSRFRARMIRNCCEFAGFNRQVLYQAIGEFGKSLTELIVLWFRPLENTRCLIKNIENQTILDEIIQKKQSVIFLTPHLGCFEILNLYASSLFPMTILYRSPKLKFLEPLMLYGRRKGMIHTATADLKGVRQIIKAIKNGECIGLLPDQVPTSGDGIWTSFFNQSAYTMNLPIKLAIQYRLPIVFAYAKRLSYGRGYHIDFKVFNFDITQPMDEIIQQMNQQIEEIIKQYPEQYLWSYNRYKQPK